MYPLQNDLKILKKVITWEMWNITKSFSLLHLKKMFSIKVFYYSCAKSENLKHVLFSLFFA